MAINRFDQPAQAQFQNTYVELPFQELFSLGRQAKDDVDRALNDLSANLEKWSDFRSPSIADTQRWYDLTTGVIEPVIDDIVSNPDLLKSAAGRAKLYGTLNNLDRASLSALQQSRDAMLQGQDYRAKLAANGRYNPLWHDVDFANYDTLGSGQIFDNISPLAYSSIQDLVDPYLKGIQDSYITTEGGYDYYGVTQDQIASVLDENLSGILTTPEAQMHIATSMRLNPDLTYEEAEQRFIDQARQDASKYARVNRNENKFALEAYRTQRELTKQAARANGTQEKNAFTTKLAYSQVRPIEPNNPDSYSPAQRAAATFANAEYANNYLAGIEKPRNEAARDIVNTLFTDIGSQAQFINAAELNTGDAVTGINGQPIYSGDNVPNVLTQEQWVNAKFGFGKEVAGWNDNRVQFERELVSGNIPGIAFTPTNKILVENDQAGRESFVQEYIAYVPVSYFRQNYEQFKSKNSDKSLLKDPKFNAFLNTLNASPASPTGDLVSRNSLPLSSTEGSFANAAYDYQRQGRWGSREWNANLAQAYSGQYVAIPAVRPVLTNELTRERANLEEFKFSNSGTKENAVFRQQNEAYLYE